MKRRHWSVLRRDPREVVQRWWKTCAALLVASSQALALQRRQTVEEPRLPGGEDEEGCLPRVALAIDLSPPGAGRPPRGPDKVVVHNTDHMATSGNGAHISAPPFTHPIATNMVKILHR
eukprot:995377-Amphidinium_carterae.1